jgi:ferredoxin
MIAAQWKPIPELVAKLRAHKKVLVAGCGTCVAECAAGGEREAETLAPLLTLALAEEGLSVDVITVTLNRQCEFIFFDDIPKLLETENIDAVVSLACGIGVQAFIEWFPDVRVYPGVNTSSLVIRESPGVWTARCEACGDCILDETFGVCPVARCSKGILNGPCGGTSNDGMCEVDPDTECAWKLIVDRAIEAGRVEDLMAVRGAKDYSNSRHGGPKRIVREDLQA